MVEQGFKTGYLLFLLLGSRWGEGMNRNKEKKQERGRDGLPTFLI
jgi:hypothetical protein